MVRVLCYAVGIISWPISKVLDYVLGDEHTVRPQLHLMSALAGNLIHPPSNEGCQASACTTIHMVVQLMWNSRQLVVHWVCLTTN